MDLSILAEILLFQKVNKQTEKREREEIKKYNILYDIIVGKGYTCPGYPASDKKENMSTNVGYTTVHQSNHFLNYYTFLYFGLCKCIRLFRAYFMAPIRAFRWLRKKLYLRFRYVLRGCRAKYHFHNFLDGNSYTGVLFSLFCMNSFYS